MPPDATRPTGIDESAPVIARHALEIDAPLARVWALHTSVEEWPDWQPDISAARLDGPFAPGSSFVWTTFGMTVTSTLYAVDARSRTLWGGTTDGGIAGVHEWRFAETPDGTLVTTWESFAGAPVDAAAGQLQPALDASLTAWLAHLQGAAEN
jgi:hypothetical protein